MQQARPLAGRDQSVRPELAVTRGGWSGLGRREIDRIPGNLGPFDWRPATPASQGLSPDRLNAFRDNLAKHGTRALLFIRHDQVVCEWYADGQSAEPERFEDRLSVEGHPDEAEPDRHR